MENKPSKRRGRPPKDLAIPKGIGEGEDAVNADDGNGPIGDKGDGAPAIDAGQGQDWDSFLARVMACTNPLIRTVYHPSPKTAIIQHHNWNLNCQQGIIGAQLVTGEYIEI